MIGRAVRRIERVEPALAARLGAAGVATVHEAQGRTGLMATAIRPIQSGAAPAGPAVTALCPPGDNWMIHVAGELMAPGDILVVATMAPSTDGYFGDLLAEAVLARSGIAAVLDCGVRDVAALRAAGFPVWCRAVSAQGTVKETVGAVNVPIVCAGVHVVPGDAVVCDDDGVAVVGRASVARVAEAAEARLAAEERKRAAIRSGAATLDLLGLRAGLAAKGFRYEEQG